MTLIVTGAAGFIGSNLVKALNERGEQRIIAVDNLTRADKFKNLVDCEIDDYLDKTEFVERFKRGDFGKVRAIFHEGACSDTMEADGRYMMDNNFRYSREVLDVCLAQNIQFLYASSAATYGGSSRFVEEREVEQPLNVYGYSKFLFDQVIRRVLPTAKSQIAGFRYFNVYGPRETHKARMASVAFHNFNQFRAEARSSCSANTTVMPPANRHATSSPSKTWLRSTCSSSTIRTSRASSTWAAAVRSRSTISRARWSTRCVR